MSVIVSDCYVIVLILGHVLRIVLYPHMSVHKEYILFYYIRVTEGKKITDSRTNKSNKSSIRRIEKK